MGTFTKSWLAVILVVSLISCGDGQKLEDTAEARSVTENTSNMATIFVGTYTRKEGHVNGQADGILTIYQDPKSGELKQGKTVAEVTNPSFVKASEDGQWLLAVSELGSGDAPSGYIYSYRIQENDTLEQISRLSTESFAPAHIALDQTGRYVFVSNYMGGVVMMYILNDDGSLEKQQRIDLENPEESHAHSVTVSGDNKHAYIADLGNDKIWIYDLNDDEGTVSPNDQRSVDLEEGAGPRHFTLSEDGKFAYSINELNSTVSVFEVQDEGGLQTLQSLSSLPKDHSGNNSGADIHLHPSGQFLYASNRGHNSITIFEVDQDNGQLTVVGHESTRGETPRNFAIAPSGEFLYVANQDSNSVAAFEVDQETGRLSPMAEPLEVMTPVCLEFLP